uniref:Uncharacterized protein n=1 Tax=Ananas comosus var. bracteatus TaxID=296719 RepID=A0A6V7QS02_ANACO
MIGKLEVRKCIAIAKLTFSALVYRYKHNAVLTVDFACLPSCSFAHACEGSSLQAGTPELAYATVARPCGIGCRSGLPWGVYTTTGPLGAAQARLPGVGPDK